MSLFKKKDDEPVAPVETPVSEGVSAGAEAPVDTQGAEPAPEHVDTFLGFKVKSRKPKNPDAIAVSEDGAELVDPDKVAVDTVIRRTDEEAHRDQRYDIPSKFAQTKIVTGVELKRICKTSVFPLTFVLGVLMVVIVSIDQVMEYLSSFLNLFFRFSLVENTDGPSTYMATMLALLPLLGVFFCASNMSTTLPAEFKERTVFLHFGLPVSKSSYYIGKFIADILPVFVLIFIGYGFALVCTSMRYDADMSAAFVLKSLGISLLTAFALSATIYCASATKAKGSTIKSLALIVVTIPVLLMVTSIIGENVSFLNGVMSSVNDVISYLPTGGFDVALYQLDSANIMLSPSAMNALGDIGYRTNSVSAGLAALVYLVWGVLFMVLGMKRYNGRQL